MSESEANNNNNNKKLTKRLQNIEEQLNIISSRFDTLNRDLDKNFQYTNDKIDDLKLHFHTVYKELMLKNGRNLFKE